MDAATVIRVAIAIGAAYLIGGIPFALIIGKRFYSVDLRECGSGNLGATNVLRTLGVKAAVIVALADISKGAIAVLLAALLVPLDVTAGPIAREVAQVGAMFAAVAGHSYSPYIKMRGGKGIATSAGALLVLTPVAWVIEVSVFVAVVALTRIVSAGSLTVAVTYPLVVMWLYPDDTLRHVVTWGLGLFVIWRHRDNIKRLWRGEERKLSVGKWPGKADKTEE